MGIFDGIASLGNRFVSAGQNFVSTANSKINAFGDTLDRFGGGGFSGIANNFDALNQAFDQQLGQIGDQFDAIDQQFDNLFGQRSRTAGLRTQGISRGAEATQASVVTARVLDGAGGVNSESNDWRVSLSVPQDISGGPIFNAFSSTGGKLVFPFNPTILFGNSANYTQVHPTHSNYAYNAYTNSQVDQITINAEFVNETEADCRYWIAVIHYLRTMTKMFYGDGDLSGNPPLVCRLNGYGKHVLNNIPVVVSNFTTDLPNDIDYLAVNIENELNYVPAQSLVTVTVLPQYSRRTTATFNLQEFAKGNFITQGTQGFI